MKTNLTLAALLLVHTASGMVRVFVEGSGGLAVVRYQCTAGEVVRAFALDVTVDQGQIIAVTNFFRGLCSAEAQGYGIFPGSFRDNVTVYSGTNADWGASGYTPLAVATDAPGRTLPGLNSAGVTLELAALWDPGVPQSVPPPSGTLCTLQLSRPANVTVSANAARGGLVAAPPDILLVPQFTGALVGPAILCTTVTNRTLTVLFQGGELEIAPAIDGPWEGSGNWSGTYTEPIADVPAKFFRVRLR